MAAFLLLLAAAVIFGNRSEDSGPMFAGTAPIPQFRVDASWPLELPNHWLLGQVGGLAVDSRGHIWALERPGSLTADELDAAADPPRSLCCIAAKPVLEFDSSGRLLQAWGGPGQGYDWPKSEHGIHVEKNGNVWIGGNSPTDRQVIKFSNDGRFLLQIGHPSSDPMDSARTDILGRPAGIDVDEAAHEAYIADGYGNRRVIVFDSETGAIKRFWGAYGNKPTDAASGAYSPAAAPAQQFGNPVHCVHLSADGLVYVCDRSNNRIQVFTKAGKFISEFFVRKETLGQGSAWDLAFSADAAQSFLYVADGQDNVIWILQRSDGKILGQFGRNGRNAGQFHWVHQIAADAAGAIYTGEVDTGKRLQRFVQAGDGSPTGKRLELQVVSPAAGLIFRAFARRRAEAEALAHALAPGLSLLGRNASPAFIHALPDALPHPGAPGAAHAEAPKEHAAKHQQAQRLPEGNGANAEERRQQPVPQERHDPAANRGENDAEHQDDRAQQVPFPSHVCSSQFMNSS